MSGFIPTEHRASGQDRIQEDRHNHRDNVDLFGVIPRCGFRGFGDDMRGVSIVLGKNREDMCISCDGFSRIDRKVMV